jgi:hypothetical protein
MSLSSKLDYIQSLNLSNTELWNTRGARGGEVAHEGSARESEKYPIPTRGVEDRTHHVSRALTKAAVSISKAEYEIAGVCFTCRKPKKKRTMYE